MSKLIPPGMESQIFGFYEITDKGSSFIGPAVVSLISQFTGSIRNSFFFVFPMLVLSCIMVYFLDDESGQAQAREYKDDNLNNKNI